MFQGTVYFDRQDYTNKVSVKLHARGFASALRQLERLHPGGWLYDIKKYGGA